MAVVVRVSVVRRLVTGDAGGLTWGEDGRGMRGVGCRGGGRRDAVGDRGRRRDVAVKGRLQVARRRLLFENRVVAETVSLGLFAVVAGWVCLVALDGERLGQNEGQWRAETRRGRKAATRTGNEHCPQKPNARRWSAPGEASAVEWRWGWKRARLAEARGSRTCRSDNKHRPVSSSRQNHIPAPPGQGSASRPAQRPLKKEAPGRLALY